MRVHVHACIKSARIMKRNIDEHYVGFDLLQNAKSSLNNSVKVKNWVILFGRPEPFKASFCEIIYRLIEIKMAEKREQRRQLDSRRPQCFSCPVQSRTQMPNYPRL